MSIGETLIARGTVTPADVQAATERQRAEGGLLETHLVTMGMVDQETIDTAMSSHPRSPNSIRDTGLSQTELLNFVTKAMYSGVETPSAIEGILKLPRTVIQQVIDEGKDRKLLDILRASSAGAAQEMCYALTEKGRMWAKNALEQNQYLGPAPVPLRMFVERIKAQRITNERIDRAAIEKAFGDLIIADEFIRRIEPALNSGRSVLLYGPPGNGKTSVAERVGSIFRDTVHIPYCFEVEGQIIKVFDPEIHTRVDQKPDDEKRQTLRRRDFDKRWVPCRRPFIVAGGELTLEMLDLSFNEIAKFYEAPLHIKALSGVFTIDDFGRQIVSPEALLNRWIVPLESGVEYLKLHTGKSFCIPFDELVVFSTNLAPSDLMDPAFLRRIPFKLEVGGPSPEQYQEIFQIVAQASGMEVMNADVEYIIHYLRRKNDYPLASYQPKFLINQVRAACKFEGIVPQFREDMIEMALSNLFTSDTAGFGQETDQAPQRRAA